MTRRGTLTAVPDEVQERLLALYEHASTCLGPVRMEWVADAGRVWVVQLHRGATKSSGTTIYPGAPASYRRFEVERGLEELRKLVSELEGGDEGIILVGEVGITSHFGDVLRRAQIPSRIE